MSSTPAVVRATAVYSSHAFSSGAAKLELKSPATSISDLQGRWLISAMTASMCEVFPGVR